MRTLTLALLTTFAAPALAEERRDPPTAEEALARADAKLDRVDATPEQRERVHALVEDAVERRETFRVEGTSIRTRLRDLLWADEIDRAALEQVREQAVDLFDRATTFGLAHLISVAEVLTPEQRRKVHDELAE